MGQIKKIDCQVERLSEGPAHHLFGFHDLLISNYGGDKYLALETQVCNRPPLPGEAFGVGYLQDRNFVKVGETVAMNYPQGARQQWVADTELFVVNNRVGGQWGTDLYDTTDGHLLQSYEGTAHMLTRDGKYALGLDYARLHRLGGYGYTGIADSEADVAMPTDKGITITDLQSGEVRLLVSVREVAACGNSNLSGQTHHYLTHLCLNPSSTRVAFLHRYFLPDGGLMTRLMTIGIDGNDLRCLGQGFLSHYHWKDDQSLYIYGRAGSSIDSLRNNALMSNPLVKHSIRLAKKVVRSIIGQGKPIGASMSFLLLADADGAAARPFAADIIPTDGHPMTHPSDSDWCICDTYPNELGDRSLFLYNFAQDLRIDLGLYRRLFAEPDMSHKVAYFEGIDSKILHLVSEQQMAFTRSGLHCDLHPRWSADGQWAVFDSIHEGTRQLYRVNVSEIIK